MANGNSDVKLQHGQVKVEAWDLCVDSTDRRKNTTPNRRALVHDFDDGLTMNWGDDYPGGVTLKGVRKIEGRHGMGSGFVRALRAITIESDLLHLLSAFGNVVCRTTKLIFQSDADDPAGVQVGGRLQFNDEVAFRGPVKVSRAVRLPTGVPQLFEYDVFDELNRLHGEVAALKNEVAALKNTPA